MNGIRDFYKALPDSAKDIFASVVNDMQSSAPEDKIERLTVFLSQLKSEIDQINKRRQAIGNQLNNVEMLVREIDKYSETHDGFELQLFKTAMLNIANQLKGEISALKPENKLVKKFDVSRRRESLLQKRKLSSHLIDIVKGNTIKPETIPVPANIEIKIEEKVPETEEIMEELEAEGKS